MAYSMGGGSRRPQRSTGDAVEDLTAALDGLAQVRPPGDAPEPILVPSVRGEVHRWLFEMRTGEKPLIEAGVRVRRKLLAYGPPGTGKTSIAHHIAARFGYPLVILGPETIGSPFVHQGSMNIGKLFDVLSASEYKTVLFMDEIESMVPDRSLSGSNQSYQQETTVMLRRFEQYDGIAIGATNKPELIDSAMWRRFNLHIEIGLPGEAERWAIIKRYSLPFELSGSSYDLLTEATAGASPAMIEELMVGMKRALVLNPLMKMSIDRPDKVLVSVVSAHKPPPEIVSEPPLWKQKYSGWEAIAKITGIDGTWPPRNVSPPKP